MEEEGEKRDKDDADQHKHVVIESEDVECARDQQEKEVTLTSPSISISVAHRFHSETTLYNSPIISKFHQTEEEDDATDDDGEMRKHSRKEGGGGIDIRKLKFQKVASVAFPTAWQKTAERGISLPFLPSQPGPLYPTSLHFVSPLNHTEEYWSSRRHRRGRGPKPTEEEKRSRTIIWFGFHPLSVSYWAEIGFLIGGILYLLGGIFASAFCYDPLSPHCASTYREILVNWFFTIASGGFVISSYFFILEVLNQPKIPYAVSSKNLSQFHLKDSKNSQVDDVENPRQGNDTRGVEKGSSSLNNLELDETPIVEFVEDTDSNEEDKKDKEQKGKATKKKNGQQKELELEDLTQLNRWKETKEKAKRELKKKKKKRKKQKQKQMQMTPSTLELFVRRPLRFKYWGWKPKLLAYWSSLFSLASSFCYLLANSMGFFSFFAFSAFPHAIPMILVIAGVLNLISSLIFFFEVCHTWFAFKPRSLSWWVVALRVGGSSCFIIGGIGSFFSDPVVVEIVNRVAFMVGSCQFITSTYLGILEVLNP